MSPLLVAILASFNNKTHLIAIEANKVALLALRETNEGGGCAIVPSRIALPYYSPIQCTNQLSTTSVAPDWTLFKPAVFYPSGLPSVKESMQSDTNDISLEHNCAENDSNSGEDEIIMGMKLVSVRGENPSRYGKPTVPATIMLLNAETGEVNAILSATYLTAARTAAGSAIATQLCLSPRSIHNLVVFGAGLQAQEHVIAMKCIVDNIANITIVNRSRDRAEKLAAYLSQTFSSTKVNVVLQSNAKKVELAVRSANVIVTATNSTIPLFQGNWVASGCHIIGVGSYTPDMKEVDKELVDRCQVVYDTKEALFVGDLKHLLEENNVSRSNQCHKSTATIRPSTILLGDLMAQPESLLNKHIENKMKAADCTFYKSVGTAIQDICTASAAVQKAKELGLGTFVDL